MFPPSSSNGIPEVRSKGSLCRLKNLSFPFLQREEQQKKPDIEPKGDSHPLDSDVRLSGGISS